MIRIILLPDLFFFPGLGSDVLGELCLPALPEDLRTSRSRSAWTEPFCLGSFGEVSGLVSHSDFRLVPGRGEDTTVVYVRRKKSIK